MQTREQARALTLLTHYENALHTAHHLAWPTLCKALLATLQHHLILSPHAEKMLAMAHTSPEHEGYPFSEEKLRIPTDATLIAPVALLRLVNWKDKTGTTSDLISDLLGPLLAFSQPSEAWETEARVLLNNFFVDPILADLRLRIEFAPTASFLIERWATKREIIHLPSESINDEKSVQADLFEFLFDAGLTLSQIGRESGDGNGNVDFLVEDVHPYTVELKIWRGYNSRGAIQQWYTQAVTYPRKLDIRRAYLVIGWADPIRRPVPQASISAPVVLSSGIEVHIRIADLCALPPSTNSKRKPYILGIEDLGPSCPIPEDS